MLYEAAEPKSFSINVAAAIDITKITNKIPINAGEKRIFIIFMLQLVTYCGYN